MLYRYRECREKYGSTYKIGKAVSGGVLFKLEEGVYSDTGEEDELEILQWRYPKAVMTLESAFFYHGLTDEIPEAYSLATERGSSKIEDSRVRQCFVPVGTIDIGKTQIEYDGDKVRIYDFERLVIELARLKTKVSYDLYKEVLESLRKRRDEIRPDVLQIYLRSFPKRGAIESIIYEELF